MTFKQIAQKYADRVEDISDERDTGDGIFVYLLPGWEWSTQTVFSGDTPDEIVRLLSECEYIATPSPCAADTTP